MAWTLRTCGLADLPNGDGHSNPRGQPTYRPYRYHPHVWTNRLAGREDFPFTRGRAGLPGQERRHARVRTGRLTGDVRRTTRADSPTYQKDSPRNRADDPTYRGGRGRPISVRTSRLTKDGGRPNCERPRRLTEWDGTPKTRGGADLPIHWNVAKRANEPAYCEWCTLTYSCVLANLPGGKDITNSCG